MSVGDWLDERTGWRRVLRHVLDEPVQGGARWSYVFGSCLTAVLAIQAITGAVMATCYSPSTTDAWASVAYLQDEMTLGWFVRGLHAVGASAMVALLLLHMLQVTVSGAYKRPREVNWLVGVVLLGITLSFALTGYLLPWDQKGYWATQVATSLAGATPLIGGTLQRLIQGGEAYGNLTLTRFYALHVLVLPATVVLFTAAHIALFRKHGVTPSWRQSDEELQSKSVPFWPNQLALDAVAVAVVMGVMVVSVVRTHGADLEAPADPTASYDARPEWYFLPLFQLLKYFPGRTEIVAALGAPLLVLGTLFALPFVDRTETRDPKRRVRFIAAVASIVLGAVGLGVVAFADDATSETYQAERHRAQREAARARALARAGVPPVGGTAVWENDPAFLARRILRERCLGCHPFQGAGERRAPSLDGWSSRRYLTAFLRQPDAPEFYGPTKIRGMKPVEGSDEEIAALVEYVYAQGDGARGAGETVELLRKRGEQLFSEKDCDSCHETDGMSSGHGPNLGGRATRQWLRAFLNDPSEGRFFGKKNAMPKFGDKLSAEEIDALVTLLSEERARR